MTIDIIKIGQIKNMKQLKNYNINKPIFLNNYLFHYLILTNNITALKLATYPINMINENDYNGIMLAAKDENYIILNYLIKKYSKYVYNKNSNNMTFLHFLQPTTKDYYKLIMHNAKMDMNQMFQTYSVKHISCLDILFKNGKYTIIKNILLKYNTIDYTIYQTQPSYFYIFGNTNLTSENIINILEIIYKSDNKILTYVDDMGYNISFSTSVLTRFILLQYIVNKCGSTLDQYTPVSTDHIFNISYKLAMKTNNYKNTLYILKNVMKNHNFNETNLKGNNIIHFILSNLYNKTLNNINKDNMKIVDILLSQYNDWHKINMNKMSPLDIIVTLDYKLFHKYVKKVNKQKINFNVIKNKKWKKYLHKLPLLKEDTVTIKILNAPYIHSNMFQARFTDSAIFSFYLKMKYKQLYLPVYEGEYQATWGLNFKLPDDMLLENNNFPWLIIWNTMENFWIHPKLNMLILKATKNKKYKYAFVILSVRLPHDGLHATLILYDFEKKIIERFDPYGNTSIFDKTMDIMLEKELTKNNTFTYVSPSFYFPVSGFQTLSDENNLLNQKLGDFGGYCLAWCFWYIEHRIINNKVDPKILIIKTLNRFMNMKIRPMEYIRNYSNMISKFRLSFFKKIGLDEKIASNEYLLDDESDLLFNAIIKYNQLMI
jgi:hypothetical protein